MKTKTVVRVLGLVAMAALTAAGAVDAEQQPAPDFVLKSIAGDNIRLSEYRGQIVMLSFWASWCGECRTQLGALDELHASYKDSGFQLLAVSLDSDRRQAADAAAALGVGFPVLHDLGGEVGRLYEVDRMPHVVVVDREGAIRAVFSGYRRDSQEQYLKSVRGLLRE